MTLSAAFVTFGPDGPLLTAAAPLPVEAMVLGRKGAEAAELLPRLFNLCRGAQGLAARMALGLAESDSGDEVQREILRDHVLKICVTLPLLFGQDRLSVPVAPETLLGRRGLPERLADLQGWDSPAAALAEKLILLFAPGLAVCAALPAPPADAPLAKGAFENSAAGRQVNHPLLRQTEAAFGRGPLWRYLGLLADLEAVLRGDLPRARLCGDVALVPAARGAYALRLTQSGGLVTGIDRRTPTDHLLAPEGALLHALATLPPALRHLAPQVIALHDPCIPVTVREASHA